MSKSMYGKHFTSTPQSQPAPLRQAEQIKNAAGGYVFKADDWTRLTRWLIIGAEGGTYYESEWSLTLQNAEVVLRCINEDYRRTVAEILRVRSGDLAPKPNSQIFALALVVAKGSVEARHAGLEILQVICTTASHVMEFIDYIQTFGTWNTQVRNAIERWYNEKPVKDLAFQMIKYRERNGVSHGDIINLAHPSPSTAEKSFLFGWATGVNKYVPTEHSGWKREEKRRAHQDDLVGVPDTESVRLIEVFEELKSERMEAAVVKAILDYRLPREALPTEWLNSPAIWEALLVNMPTNALIRNLNKMSALKMFDAPFSNALNVALDLLSNEDKVRKSRVHPLWVLSSTKQYGMGHGERGSLSWTANRRILDALDSTFQYSFHNVQPVNANIAVAVDSSGSMSGNGYPDRVSVSGVPGFTPLEAAVATAMVYMRAQTNSYVFFFDTQIREMSVSPKDSLHSILSVAARFSGGGTNCGVVADHIARNRWPVDGIFMITDGESWVGDGHTFQSIQAMRQAIGRPTKWVTMMTTASAGQLNDPRDPLSMETCGFSPDILTVANSFFSGELG